jgi:hypothetical protein
MQENSGWGRCLKVEDSDYMEISFYPITRYGGGALASMLGRLLAS